MPYGNPQRNSRKRESSGSYGYSGQAQRSRYDNSNNFNQQQNFNQNFSNPNFQQMGFNPNFNQNQGMGDMYEQRMMQLLSAERRLNQLESINNMNAVNSFQGNQNFGNQNRSRDDRRQNRGRSDSRGRSDNRNNRSPRGSLDRNRSQGDRRQGGRDRSADNRRNDNRGHRDQRGGFRRKYDFTPVTGRLDKSGRINFPDIPVKRMLQGDVLLALEDVKGRIKRIAKNKKDAWKDLDAILADNFLHGSTVFYHEKMEEGMCYVCELYVGNFLIAIGKTDDQNRLSARQKAYEEATDKLCRLTPGECLNFSKYLGIKMFKDKDVDVALSPYICKESNLGNLMLTRENMEPRPLGSIVILKPENDDRRSRTEVVRASCDFNEMAIEYYFFRNRKPMISGSDRLSKIRCELYIEKKLVARSTGLHLQEAKNRVSNDTLSNLTKKCYSIETKPLQNEPIDKAIEESIEDLAENKESYVTDPTLYSYRLMSLLSGEKKDEIDIATHVITVTKADVIPEGEEEEAEEPAEEKKEEESTEKEEKMETNEDEKKEDDEKKDEEKEDEKKDDEEKKESPKDEKETKKDEKETKKDDKETKKDEKETKKDDKKTFKKPKRDLELKEEHLNRVKVILDKYRESEAFDNLVFSHEFNSQQRKQIIDLKVEGMKIEYLKLEGSGNKTVLLVRKEIGAHDLVDLLKKVGGTLPRYKLCEPATPVDYTSDADLVLTDSKPEKQDDEKSEKKDKDAAEKDKNGGNKSDHSDKEDDDEADAHHDDDEHHDDDDHHGDEGADADDAELEGDVEGDESEGDGADAEVDESMLDAEDQ